MNLRGSHNTSNKFVGKVDLADARAMGERIRVDPEEILNLGKKDRPYTEYFCHIKDTTPRAIKLRVPLGVVNQKERMSDENYSLLIQKNRKKYCFQIDSKGKPKPVKPVETDNKAFKVGERIKL